MAQAAVNPSAKTPGRKPPAKLRSVPTAAPPTPAGSAGDFDLDRALDGLRDEYIQCRDFGHSWRPYSARFEPKERAYLQDLRCSRCKTIRSRWIGQHGELMASNYDYPDGYTLPGSGRLSGSDRDAIRFRSIQRLLPTDTTED